MADVSVHNSPKPNAMSYVQQLETALAPELNEIAEVEQELGLSGVLRYGEKDGGRAYEIKQMLERLYRQSVGLDRWQYFAFGKFFDGKCPRFYLGNKIQISEDEAKAAIENGFLEAVEAWRAGAPLEWKATAAAAPAKLEER